MPTTSPHHYYEETPEERLSREIEFYKELKEDETGRLHDEFGRFASEKQDQVNMEPSFLEGLKDWGELLGLFSIDYINKKGEVLGEYVPRVRIHKRTWVLLGFLTIEIIKNSLGR